MRLENKVALITGAAHGVTGEVQGFGGVAARMFAEEGAKVVLTDIDTDSGERTEAELKENGHDVIFVKLDVTSESDWETAIEATVSSYGGLDILVNNAGIGGAAPVGGNHRRGLGPPDGHTRQGCLPRHSVCHSPHARRRRRLYNQHLVHIRHRRQPRLPAPTTPPRARFAYSPSPLQSSSPQTTSGSTPCIPASWPRR